MQRAVPKCTALIALCNAVGGMFCDTALSFCGEALIFPVEAEGWNQYDLRIKCQKAPLCYDFSPVIAFLNKQDVRQKLNIPSTVRKWEECSGPVNRRFHKDWMHNFDHKLPDLLNDGIAVLIYAGDADYICNWKGNKVWTLALKWDKAEEFRTAKDVEWNNKAGKLRQAGPFSFLQVYNAGHMVPMDQPKASLDMLNQFTKGTLKLHTEQPEQSNEQYDEQYDLED
jgi:cathepsin A (carboxypeptidase C)